MNIKIVLFAFIAICLFWIWLIHSILTSSMPYNTLSPFLVTKKSTVFKSIFPEGFSFFTRDPREPQPIIYSKDKKDLLKENSSSFKSFFGFNRYRRALTLELGTIVGVVKDLDWLECYTGDPIDCFKDNNLPIHYVRNLTPNPILCGDYYIKIVEPIPWAWAESFKKKERNMPFKIIKVSITCD